MAVLCFLIGSATYFCVLSVMRIVGFNKDMAKDLSYVLATALLLGWRT